MDFQNLLDRALQVREQYTDFEQKNFGRSWTREEVVMGFIGDVGDLVKLTMAEIGVRNIPDARHKLAHEMADCLWSILVLSHLYEIDLEAAFLKTMDELEGHISSNPD